MKAFGIAAFIIAVVAIFIPGGGPPLTMLSALLAAFAFRGGINWCVAAVTINVLNIVLLSPSLLGLAGLGSILAGDRATFMDFVTGVGLTFLLPQAGALAFAVLVTLATGWKGDTVQVRKCTRCNAPNPIGTPKCPHCGWILSTD
ncbi:MAG: hypothetical protein ACEQSH_00635 [Bacteroidia bacterium]